MKNTNKHKSVSLQRTFMLVFGGSGAETMIQTAAGPLTSWQPGSHAARPVSLLDTDPRWYEDHLSKVEQHVRISEAEYVDIQLPGAAELYRGIRRGG